jgi:hypothetical protein
MIQLTNVGIILFSILHCSSKKSSIIKKKKKIKKGKLSILFKEINLIACAKWIVFYVITFYCRQWNIDHINKINKND